jgi:hypothetical protein
MFAAIFLSLVVMGSVKILKDEFPLVPVKHIRSVAESQKTLFATCMAIKKSEVLSQANDCTSYQQLKKPRRPDTIKSHFIDLATKSELKAAIKAANKDMGMLFIKSSKDLGC